MEYSTSKLSQMKRSYTINLEQAKKEVQSKFIKDILELRKTCNHISGAIHLTGIGTKVVFCRSCGGVIDEYVA